MALFSITCTTCNARLSVRDEAVIGEILACPKCQSMVLVEPPPGWNGAGNAAPAQAQRKTSTAGKRVSPAPAESTFDDAAALLSDEPSATPEPFLAGAPSAAPADTPDSATNVSDVGETIDQPIEMQLAAEQAARSNSKPHDSPSGAKTAIPKSPPPPIPKPRTPATKKPAAQQPAKPAAAPDAEEVPTADSAEPLLPDGQWSSASTQRWRQWALLVGGGVAGLLLAVTAFGYLVSRGTADSPEVASTSDGLADVTPNAPTTDAPPSADGDAPTSHDPPTASDGSLTPAATEPKTNGDDADTSAPADVSSTTDGAPKPAPADPVKPPAETPINPFERDPVPRPAAPTDKPEPEAPADSVEDVTKDLAEFAPFLNDVPFLPDAATRPADKDRDAADEAPPAREFEPEVDKSRAPRPAPRNVDVEAQLALPIAQIEFTRTPLIEFVRFLSELSNLPITVEPEALVFAAMSPSTPIDVQLSDTTVRAALQKAIGTRLNFAAADGQIRIPDPLKTSENSYPVDDLVDSETGLRELRQTVSELIEPDLWLGGASAEDAAGPSLKTKDNKLIVRAGPSTQVEMLVFCQKLRVARGKPLLRYSVPSDLFDLTPRRERAEAKLATPLSLNYGRPTPLVDILARMERETGMRILVDWSALADEDWNPDGTATLTADKQPLGEALSSLLLPLDLTWRVVDAGTLQVTTPAVLAARAELEFYPAGDLLDDGGSAALLTRIRTALGPNQFRDAGGVGELHFDEPSKCVIAALPQPQQRELTALLKGWRGK